MIDYLSETKTYHDKKYKEFKYSFQRKSPNEDVIRFENKFLKQRSNILDIGCGTGRNAVFLINKKHKVDCLDFSAQGLRLLKKLFEKKKINFLKNKLFLDSIPHMKKINYNYDAIIDCFTSYALIKNDFKIYVSRISKLLKKKGVFHLQTFSKNSDLFRRPYPSKIVFKNSINRIKRKTAPFYGDEYLFSFYTKKELIDILKKNFQKINFETHSRTYRNGKEYVEFFVVDCIK